MDRNTVVGLVLIGLILSVFTIFNQPSEEEIKAEQEKIEQAKLDAAEAEEEKQAAETADTIAEVLPSIVPKLDKEGNQLEDENGGLIFLDTITGLDTTIAKTPVSIEEENTVTEKAISGQLIRLENEKLIVDFDTKGGTIAGVRLKEFETYHDYAKNDDEHVPLVFFQAGDATNGISFPMGDRNVNTKDQLFSVKSQTSSKIVFELKGDDKEAIEFVYELKPNAYDIVHDINIRGYQGKVTPRNVMFNWTAELRKTERLFSEQRRVSTICYNYKNEGFSYLSEIGDDDIAAEDEIEWFSFKQSYFSAFVHPEKAFAKDGSKLKVNAYDSESDDAPAEGNATKKSWKYLKEYNAEMNLNLTNVENVSVRMNWFFGPNDYDVLTSYDAGYDNVLNYGWGIFRWINLYAVQPIFNVLTSTGMSIGIAILILTLLIKFMLMPIQWKMYTSSAKMRILRPEIEEINAKYPEKEDAMKKQMETMTLYRESGASPLAGCVPMLIQMPILLAVFRFFPSTFDLRQKSFLWAEDLSSYDSIYELGFNVWPYGDHVSLFTLLMAGTTLIYTVINSGNMQAQQQPGMPNMKIIMYFFPIMMIFFFNNYSSGLSYYYFISTLTSIVIMLMIKRFFVDEEKLKAKMAQRKATAAATPGKGKKKSKFQERLEQMQKAQQEQKNSRKK